MTQGRNGGRYDRLITDYVMRFEPTRLPGCLLVHPTPFRDDRGRFVKVFHTPLFLEQGLVTDFAEEYYSVSQPGVLRGMHFQLPPRDHAKLVFCTAGEVLDVIVDIRRGSPTFGEHVMVELSAEAGTMVYIPRGMAHGFYVPRETSTLVYMVETVHSPPHDAGIAWDGCGIVWPTSSPQLSARDKALPRLDAFETPFTFVGASSP